jgi:hypothetical protein
LNVLSELQAAGIDQPNQKFLALTVVDVKGNNVPLLVDCEHQHTETGVRNRQLSQLAIANNKHALAERWKGGR